MLPFSSSGTEQNISRILDEIADVRKSQERIEEFLLSCRDTPNWTVSAEAGETSRNFDEDESGFLEQDTAFPRQTSDDGATSWPRNVRLREIYSEIYTSRSTSQVEEVDVLKVIGHHRHQPPRSSPWRCR